MATVSRRLHEEHPSAARLRVCQLIYGLDIGGAERMVLELAQRLPPARFAVEVATLTGPGVYGPMLAATGIPVRALRLGTQPRFGLFWHLTRYLQHGRFHILHTHLPRANWAGRLAGSLAGVPVIVSTQHANLQYLLPWQRGIERVSSRLDDRVMCVSSALAGYLTTSVGIPPHKLVVIPSGVQTQTPHGAHSRQTARRLLGLDDQHVVIGFVGRLVEQKNPLALVAAARHLVQQLPALRVVVLGDGPLRTSLERAIAAYELNDVFQLLGFRRDVAELLPAFDVLALPSRFEVLPVAVLEAMAAALPVVATAVDGTPEAVQDEVTGSLVPPDDDQAFTEALRHLLADRERAEQMGQAGRQRVKALFSWERRTAQVEALYEQLSANKAGRGLPALSPHAADTPASGTPNGSLDAGLVKW